MTVNELIQQLRQFPEDWRVYATRAGSSLEVWEADGDQYAYVFTDEREPRRLRRRRKEGDR